MESVVKNPDLGAICPSIIESFSAVFSIASSCLYPGGRSFSSVVDDGLPLCLDAILALSVESCDSQYVFVVLTISEGHPLYLDANTEFISHSVHDYALFYLDAIFALSIVCSVSQSLRSSDAIFDLMKESF